MSPKSTAPFVKFLKRPDSIYSAKSEKMIVRILFGMTTAVCAVSSLCSFVFLRADVETTIKEQKVKLFIAPGITEDTRFEPRTRKEIGMIAWFPVADLPTTAAEAKGMPSEYDSTGNNFFMVIPFVNKLTKWISKYGKKRLKEQQRKEWVKEVMGTVTPGKPQYPNGSSGQEAPTSTQKTPSSRQKQHQTPSTNQFYANPAWMSGTNPTAINLMRQLDAAAVQQAAVPLEPLRTFAFRMPDIMAALSTAK
jgi:hypothetical protein